MNSLNKRLTLVEKVWDRDHIYDRFSERGKWKQKKYILEKVDLEPIRKTIEVNWFRR